MIAVFKRILKFITEDSDQPASDNSAAAGADRRTAFRFRLDGFEIGVRGGNGRSTMQLKDLSCTGGAGITDLAVPVGGTIILELADGEARTAQIRWVRNWTVGFRFIRPLESELIVQLYSRRWCSFPRLDASVPAGEAPSNAA